MKCGVRIYQTGWKCRLLTPVYKKGDAIDKKNYRPLCMISSAREVVEEVTPERIMNSRKAYGRQFCFQRRLYPTVTLMDVNAVVKAGKNRIATLDLAKEYEKSEYENFTRGL